MSSDANGREPSRGLPPVVPPSGRLLAQLFLVPGLIVAGAVIVLLGFTWLAGIGGTADKQKYLENLKSPNADIRWRTASDLAQVLKRDEQLASDVDFGKKLSELLRDALADLERAERDMAAEPREDAQRMTKARQAFLNQRSNVQYLCNCLGNLHTPVGAPVLAELARKKVSNDPKTEALLQRQAVWALATLGESLSRHRQQTDGNRTDVSEQSAAIAAILDRAEADDPFLRKLSALALTFWEGTPTENRRIEEALVRLTRDDGHGTIVEIGEVD